jgi:pyruvate formate lyase activating enzyme
MSWQKQLHTFDPESKNKPGLTGLVFDIQRFAVHDGDGIRTLVFLKGCPLSCTWCQNPESMSRQPELWTLSHRCIDCNICIETCPTGALSRSDNGIQIDRDACTLCGDCVGTCYAGAMNMVGRYLTVDELFAEIERDRPFYETSGGGITFSGGEPTLQPDFLKAMLVKCKENGLSTAIETCGAASWETLSGLLEHLDLVLTDIKHMDPAAHKQLTGSSNERILENIRNLDDAGMRLRLRMPLVPSLNDSDENLHATADFVRSLKNVERFDLLPYHRLGEPKWEQLNRCYALHGTPPPNKEHVHRCADLFKDAGIPISVGGN